MRELLKRVSPTRSKVVLSFKAQVLLELGISEALEETQAAFRYLWQRLMSVRLELGLTEECLFVGEVVACIQMASKIVCSGSFDLSLSTWSLGSKLTAMRLQKVMHLVCWNEYYSQHSHAGSRTVSTEKRDENFQDCSASLKRYLNYCPAISFIKYIKI